MSRSHERRCRRNGRRRKSNGSDDWWRGTETAQAWPMRQEPLKKKPRKPEKRHKTASR